MSSAHEGLVGVLDVGLDHLEVTDLVRIVAHLDDVVAGVVDVLAHVAQLDDVVVVLGGRAAAGAVELVDERRTIGRREDEAAVAAPRALLLVAGFERELARSLGDTGLDELAVEIDAGAVDLAAMLFEHLDCRSVLEVNADLGQDLHDLFVDTVDLVVSQDALGRNARHLISFLLDCSPLQDLYFHPQLRLRNCLLSEGPGEDHAPGPLVLYSA